MNTNAEGFVKPGSGEPGSAEWPRIQISVLFTSPASTRAALRHAATLARGLDAQVVLLWARVVPYPLDLFAPVGISIDRERLRRMAEDSPGGIKALLCLCRDELEALRLALPAGSLVVMGGGNGWWSTREQKLAKHLREAGHEVVVVDRAGELMGLRAFGGSCRASWGWNRR